MMEVKRWRWGGDAIDGDEEVSVEAEEDNEAVVVENAEDLPNEESSASGVNHGAA